MCLQIGMQEYACGSCALSVIQIVPPRLHLKLRWLRQWVSCPLACHATVNVNQIVDSSFILKTLKFFFSFQE